MTNRTPKALQDRPQLQPELLVYWQAYQRLSRARLWLDGIPQAITVAECAVYCNALRWTTPEFFSDFLDLMQDMDDTFVAHMAKKAEERSKARSTDSDVVTQ
jgi:hypothetical protein